LSIEVSRTSASWIYRTGEGKGAEGKRRVKEEKKEKESNKGRKIISLCFILYFSLTSAHISNFLEFLQVLCYCFLRGILIKMPIML